MSVSSKAVARLSPMISRKSPCAAEKIASGSPNALSSLRCVSLPMPGMSVNRSQSLSDSVEDIGQGVRTKSLTSTVPSDWTTSAYDM